MKRQVKIGIPRALSYFTFFPLWKVFLEQLGATVVVSKPTNRKILEEGIKETVNDACIPIKVFHGHVFDLAGKVDYIFTPRMISADGKATFCPKFLGLPDMVRYADVDLPELIDVRYHCRLIPGGQLHFFFAVAKQLGIRNPFTVFRAVVKAVFRQKQYQKYLLRGLKPLDAFDAVFSDKKKIDFARDKKKQIICGDIPVTVALLGYPYAVYDIFISAGIYDKLVKLGAEVVTFEDVPLKNMRHFSKQMPQNFFWYYSNQVCWAGLYFLDKENRVDGIVHVTAFGCGPDAMVDKTMELEAKAVGIPFLSLTIDEHTGEGGIQTRLEAFVDMLVEKKAKSRAG